MLSDAIYGAIIIIMIVQSRALCVKSLLMPALFRVDMLWPAKHVPPEPSAALSAGSVTVIIIIT